MIRAQEAAAGHPLERPALGLDLATNVVAVSVELVYEPALEKASFVPKADTGAGNPLARSGCTLI